MFALPDDLADIIQFDARNRQVSSREGKHREFKRDFAPADFSDYTKALAAFSNTDGGCLIFGISDKPRLITGVNAAAIPDEANLTNRIREDFEPEIVFSTKSYHIGGQNVFVLGVEASPYRPVICRRTRSRQVAGKAGVMKDVEVLREGTIYYRYAGQTRPIGFTELTAMLEERERRRMQKILETLQVVERVGFDRAGVIDLKAGDASNVFISREAAKELHFIDKANVVEEDGAPAYVVMGQVQLANVVHAPIDEADKNLPSEAANQLKPVVARVYGNGQSISPSQVTKLLQHLGLHESPVHCVQEKKLRRKYVTREGIRAVRSLIEARPLEAIRAFGSQAAIAQYEEALQPPPAA